MGAITRAKIWDLVLVRDLRTSAVVNIDYIGNLCAVAHAGVARLFSLGGNFFSGMGCVLYFFV